MLKEEERLLLQVLGSALHGDPLPVIEEAQWEPLLSEMETQCISIFPADHLDDFPLTPLQLNDYLGSVGKAIQYFHNLMQEQTHVIELLEEAGIPVAVLKGAAAAMSYPHPEYRTMGDIDLIVPRDHFAAAYNILSSNNYQLDGNNTLENYSRHIGFFGESGIEIELHHNFSSSLNRKHNEILDQLIEGDISKAVPAEINGFPVPVLPPLTNGLVLLGHIRQHLGDGLGLRQMVDWMMYVESYLDDDFWNTSFSDAAASVGLQKLALISTAMCRKYLGLSPSITWCDLTSPEDEVLCDQLMEYIMSQGNFGRKMDRHKNVSISRLRLLRNPKKLFLTAQKFGKANWKLLGKYPQLKCVAWLYQFFAWPVHAIKKGYTIKGVLSHSRQAGETDKFLNKLM